MQEPLAFLRSPSKRSSNLPFVGENRQYKPSPKPSTVPPVPIPKNASQPFVPLAGSSPFTERVPDSPLQIKIAATEAGSRELPVTAPLAPQPPVSFVPNEFRVYEQTPVLNPAKDLEQHAWFDDKTGLWHLPTFPSTQTRGSMKEVADFLTEQLASIEDSASRPFECLKQQQELYGRVFLEVAEQLSIKRPDIGNLLQRIWKGNMVSSRGILQAMRNANVTEIAELTKLHKVSMTEQESVHRSALEDMERNAKRQLDHTLDRHEADIRVLLNALRTGEAELEFYARQQQLLETEIAELKALVKLQQDAHAELYKEHSDLLWKIEYSNIRIPEPPEEEHPGGDMRSRRQTVAFVESDESFTDSSEDDAADVTVAGVAHAEYPRDVHHFRPPSPKAKPRRRVMPNSNSASDRGSRVTTDSLPREHRRSSRRPEQKRSDLLRMSVANALAVTDVLAEPIRRSRASIVSETPVLTPSQFSRTLGSMFSVNSLESPDEDESFLPATTATTTNSIAPVSPRTARKSQASFSPLARMSISSRQSAAALNP